MQFKFMARKRPRVSAAILRNGGSEVLMVCHVRKDGSTYWQLPGGGLHRGEKAEAGALRELLEETGLHGRVVRWLFSIPYKYGSSTTFLVEIEEGQRQSWAVTQKKRSEGFANSLTWHGNP